MVPTSRREFLNRVLTGGVAILTGYFVYPVVRFLIPPPVAVDQQTKVMVATTDELKLNSAKFFRFLDKPGVVVRLPNGEYKALSAKCTHLGCTVAFEPRPDTSGGGPDLSAQAEDFFYCNCHGSEFDINGKVLKGPAALPLTQYSVSISDNKIYVSVQGQTA